MPQEDECEGRLPHAVPRGLLRFVILKLLESQELSGTGIADILEERSKGVWRPSPGSTYHLLSSLQERGHIEEARTEGRTIFYRLSEAGREALENIHEQKKALDKRAAVGPMLWLSMLSSEDRVHAQLKHLEGAVDRLEDTFSQLGREEKEEYLERLRTIRSCLSKIINDIK